MKRFYAIAAAADGGTVVLDGRPVRTPARGFLVLPTSALADAVAAEWAAQGETIQPGTMKLTGLANAAIDRVAPDPVSFAAGLASYADSDLLCYRAPEPATLVTRQNAAWDPLLAWAGERYGLSFSVTAGIVHRAQPEDTIARLAAAIAALDAFKLSALSPIVTISGSLVIALAMLEREIDPEAAFAASRLDEDWQAEQWGEDSLALAARANARADFLAAARFLSLLG